ncbi:YitT family protein [Marinospirillum perlucidum]|uniref:YitT family protein n=1 Tax=Marinospirillum perlucidum TaxID=1982602 RepID=UPI003CCC58E3
MDRTETPQQHSLVEDGLALITATPLVALGITLYSEAELLTGSTAGLAFLIKYMSGWGFGPIFFLLNLPFYLLAFLRMGWKFTLRTFMAVGLVSVFAEWTPYWIDFSRVEAVYAALLGGMCMGLGILMLFRHRASLGGVNILALYLQDKFSIRAGKFQMGVDLCIVLGAFFVLPPDKVLLSILGAGMLNLILTLNHKPGRYQGVS